MLKQETFSDNEEIFGRMLDYGKPVSLPHIGPEVAVRKSNMEHLNIRNLLMAPLFGSREPIGVAVLINKRENNLESG